MTPQIVDAPPYTMNVEEGHEDKGRPADQASLDVEKKIDPPPAMDAFGDEEFAEVKYKTMNWWQCGLLMVAETVSLGILSLPGAVAGIGMAPAVVILIGLGIMATYTGYVIGQFKWKYPQVCNMADAGEVMAGPIGREVLGVAQMLFLVFIMASHILTFTVALNTITEHATCTIVFGVVGLVVSFVCSLPRTLEKMSWLSLVSFISIVAAVLVAMIALGIQRPGDVVKATVDTSFYHGFTSVTNIVFAFAGHAAFFGLMAELRDPYDFPKSLFLLQGIDVSLYLVAAVVIYYYAGPGVESPALGSAGPLLSKISYGIALPTIIIAGVINGHVAFKLVYVRIFAGTDRMHKRDWVSVGTWIAIGLVLWIIAWIIAEAIPVFDNLLSLIVALFASWFTYGLSGVFWLYMNWGLYFSSWRKMVLTVVNVFIFGIGAALCGLGLYVSGKAIHDNTGSQSFSCAA